MAFNSPADRRLNANVSSTKPVAPSGKSSLTRLPGSQALFELRAAAISLLVIGLSYVIAFTNVESLPSKLHAGFVVELPVVWGEMDSYRHVNNVVYYSFFDTVVNAWLIERGALDIYEPYFVAEMRNGQVGLYKLEKNEVVATAVLSNASLGRLRVAETSPELKWLALSGRSRGGVWNLGKGEAALSLRNFQGGYVSDEGYFFGEFPKTEDVERNVARFNLNNGEAVAGPKIEGDSSHQYGQYLFTIKSAKPAEKAPGAGDKPAKLNPAEYRRNVIIEMFDARTMKSLWSQAFPKEAPRVWIAPGNHTMAMLWSLTTDAAKAEISADPQLTRSLAKMKEKEGDYFLKIVQAQTGKEIGKLLIETGKGSFGVSNIFAAGDSVIVTDTRNRVLVYSLKTGEQKGRVFGAYATVSPASKLLCVENESGKLAVYDLETMEKRDEFIFTRPISMLRFSQDGKRLFVLTVAQTVYILDVSPLAKT